MPAAVTYPACPSLPPTLSPDWSCRCLSQPLRLIKTLCTVGGGRTLCRASTPFTFLVNTGSMKSQRGFLLFFFFRLSELISCPLSTPRPHNLVSRCWSFLVITPRGLKVCTTTSEAHGASTLKVEKACFSRTLFTYISSQCC